MGLAQLIAKRRVHVCVATDRYSRWKCVPPVIYSCTFGRDSVRLCVYRVSRRLSIFLGKNHLASSKVFSARAVIPKFCDAFHNSTPPLSLSWRRFFIFSVSGFPKKVARTRTRTRTRMRPMTARPPRTTNAKHRASETKQELKWVVERTLGSFQEDEVLQEAAAEVRAGGAGGGADDWGHVLSRRR